MNTLIPYGKQLVEQDDIDAVVDVLKSDYLTTGPEVGQFENAFAEYVATRHAIALSSGTAALHAAVSALNIGPGDEVIVPPITFAATANCVTYRGATPVFADVFPDTLLIDPADVAAKITPHTKAIIAVDFAGQTCDYEQLRELCSIHGIYLIADCCHSLGATSGGDKAGNLADMSCFSFHPVKSITAGEGGMVTTNVDAWAERIRRFRNHGIDSDFRTRQTEGQWRYNVIEEGFNYRLSDIHSALGKSQLSKLDGWVDRRRQIALQYAEFLCGSEYCIPVAQQNPGEHAFHLFVINWSETVTGKNRDQAFTELRNRGIGVNVHYWPVHLQTYYLDQFGTDCGMCPEAEAASLHILSLPIFQSMTDGQVKLVLQNLEAVAKSRKIAA